MFSVRPVDATRPAAPLPSLILISFLFRTTLSSNDDSCEEWEEKKHFLLCALCFVHTWLYVVSYLRWAFVIPELLFESPVEFSFFKTWTLTFDRDCSDILMTLWFLLVLKLKLNSQTSLRHCRNVSKFRKTDLNFWNFVLQKADEEVC